MESILLLLDQQLGEKQQDHKEEAKEAREMLRDFSVGVGTRQNVPKLLQPL